MSLRPAPAFVEACAAAATGEGGAAATRPHDALVLRALLDAELPSAFAGSTPAPEVVRRDAVVSAGDGVPVPVRWYAGPGVGPGSAVVFFHGGGLVAGSIEVYDAYVAQHVQWTGVPALSVGYRRAPEGTGEEPARDGLAALQWLHRCAPTLGVDPQRIAVMGDSAGGGIAAAVALLARETGVPVCRQVLVFPMLDDRTTTPDPHLAGATTWSYADNRTGWRALLGERVGGPHVTAVEAPARLVHAGGMPPAYIEVGSLDVFRDECVAYAQRLWTCGVEAELHVHPGAPHGYDSVALDSDFAQRWRADRVRVLRSL
jgi:acetyl esterase/lipase